MALKKKGYQFSFYHEFFICFIEMTVAWFGQNILSEIDTNDFVSQKIYPD